MKIAPIEYVPQHELGPYLHEQTPNQHQQLNIK